MEPSWQIGKTWKEQLKYMLEQELWADLELLVGKKEEKICCQRAFLAKSSPVFAALCYGEIKVAGPVKIPDIEGDVFRILLLYMYTSDLDLTSCDINMVARLLYAAKKYILPSVEEACITSLQVSLSPESVCEIYEEAKYLDIPILVEECLEMLKKVTREVIQADSFTNIQQDTLVTLLQMDQLNVDTEKQLVDSVSSWAVCEAGRKELTTDENGLREALGPALSHLRFLAMSLQEFVEGPLFGPLLTDSEKTTIMMNITSPGATPLPPNICNISKVRKTLPPLIITFRKRCSPISVYFKSNLPISFVGVEINNICSNDSNYLLSVEKCNKNEAETCSILYSDFTCLEYFPDDLLLTTPMQIVENVEYQIKIIGSGISCRGRNRHSTRDYTTDNIHGWSRKVSNENDTTITSIIFKKIPFK